MRKYLRDKYDFKIHSFGGPVKRLLKKFLMKNLRIEN